MGNSTGPGLQLFLTLLRATGDSPPEIDANSSILPAGQAWDVERASTFFLLRSCSQQRKWWKANPSFAMPSVSSSGLSAATRQFDCTNHPPSITLHLHNRSRWL